MVDTEDHAHQGAILAREILSSLQIINDNETKMICDTLYTHNDKEIIHSDFNEVLKDADVFHQCLYNPTVEIWAPERKNRYKRLKHEFGID